ncbi:hypothetical protein KY331_06490 [Candidatus Woesearchaeota archaeon]|nr:hypothetical protein [Candidatus Woesearchaeota archaeon]
MSESKDNPGEKDSPTKDARELAEQVAGLPSPQELEKLKADAQYAERVRQTLIDMGFDPEHPEKLPDNLKELLEKTGTTSEPAPAGTIDSSITQEALEVAGLLDNLPSPEAYQAVIQVLEDNGAKPEDTTPENIANTLKSYLGKPKDGISPEELARLRTEAQYAEKIKKAFLSYGLSESDLAPEKIRDTLKERLERAKKEVPEATKKELADLKEYKTILDAVREKLKGKAKEEDLTSEKLPATLEGILNKPEAEAPDLPEEESNYILLLRDAFAEEASRIPQTRQKALGIDLKELRADKKPAQLALLLKSYFGPVISGYNKSLNTLAAFKGQRTYLGTELVLNPKTYDYIKARLNVNELDEKTLGSVRVSASTLREHLKDAEWLYGRAKVRAEEPEITKIIVGKAGEQILKKARDYALERACENYNAETGEGEIDKDLVADFKKLEQYKDLEGEELQKAVRQKVEQAAEASYIRLVVNRLVEKNLTFNDIWDKCLKPYIESSTEQSLTPEERQEVEKVITRIVSFQQNPVYCSKDKADGNNLSWRLRFEEIYDPSTIADETAKQKLNEIVEGFSKPGSSREELYQRLAGLVIDSPDVRAKFFEIESEIYKEAIELERALKTYADEIEARDKQIEAKDKDLKSRDGRIKELEEAAKTHTGDDEKLAEKLKSADEKNQELEGKLEGMKQKVPLLYGAIDKLYEEAKDLRDLELYNEAADQLELVKRLVDVVSQVQECPQYSHIDAEFACNLLLLAHDTENKLQKRQYLNEAVALSLPSIKSTKVIEKAKVIAATNLNYAYTQLANLAGGEGDTENEKRFRELAANYVIATDEDCAKLGLKRF